jgi:hypothetical protein
MSDGPRIVPGFEKYVKYAVATAKAIADAVSKQQTAKPWMNLNGSQLQQKATEKLETDVGKVFKRDDANGDYEKARTDVKAKAKQIALAKLAGDYLAACERDKRMQWRSRIRMAAHATSRQFGNGKDSGPLQLNTVNYLSRIFLKSQEGKTGDGS